MLKENHKWEDIIKPHQRITKCKEDNQTTHKMYKIRKVFLTKMQKEKDQNL
jgi:hypothetical protein